MLPIIGGPSRIIETLTAPDRFLQTLFTCNPYRMKIATAEMKA
jgi:hypothetical protein